MALTYIKTSGLDPTSTFTFANVSLSGNIIPESNNVSTLGDPTHVFKDVYIGPGSLYIDGSKVLEASGSDIIVTADINQNLRVVTSGSGDIELDPTGTGVVALKGPLQFEAGSQATSSDGNSIAYADPIAVDALGSLTANTDLTLTGNGTGLVKIDDDLTVTGNLILQGTGGNLSVTNLIVQDNIIDISAETTGAPSANAGLRVIRGDDPSVQFRWNEVSDVWQITTDGTVYLDIVGKDSAGNVSVGNLSATGLSGTLSTAAQPNITSVGSLASLTVTGLITATAGGIKVGNLQDTSGTNTIQVSSGTTGIIGNLNVGTGGTGNVTATYFIGNGSQLTGISSYSDSNVAVYLPTYDGNILASIISTDNVTETRSAPTISGGSLTIDLNTATVFDVALNGAITTLTLSNVQSSGKTSSFVLMFTADGTARSVTWPASFKWPAGTAPTLTSTSGKKDVFVFFTVDGGTSWQAFISGQNL